MSIPPDAATFRVQLWLNAAAGWVAFDDVSVRLVDGVTKYYYFNGQRIAMRQDNSLSYLHSDHLGSVVAATDEIGAVINDNQPRYSAYGHERTASVNGLPTEYTFTGQRQDNTGLSYMNARYYDPETGQFISSYPPGPNKRADWQDGRIGCRDAQSAHPANPHAAFPYTVQPDGTPSASAAPPGYSAVRAPGASHAAPTTQSRPSMSYPPR